MAVWLAFVHAALGDRDEAFKLLDQAYRRRDTALLSIPTIHEFQGLRSDPRFQELVRRMQVPQHQP